MMADRTGCKSKEEYILTHEIPKEKRKALQELVQDNKSNSNYRNMVEYLYDKERKRGGMPVFMKTTLQWIGVVDGVLAVNGINY